MSVCVRSSIFSQWSENLIPIFMNKINLYHLGHLRHFFNALFFYLENGFLLVKFFSCLVYRGIEICFTEKNCIEVLSDSIWFEYRLTWHTHTAHIQFHAPSVPSEPAIRELTGIWSFLIGPASYGITQLWQGL